MSVAPPPLAPRCAPALGFVIFDGFELLDLTGPYSILSSAAKLRPDLGWSLHLVAPKKGPVQSGQHKPHSLAVRGGHELDGVCRQSGRRQPFLKAIQDSA